MDDIRLLRANYLRGPNIWTYRPALEAWLDLGDLEDRPSNTIPGFRDRLVAMLPGLVEHHCGVGERGGFLQRLDGGTMAGHVLEHVVIELLNLAGMPTGFGQTRSTSRRGVYRMAFRARDERVARVALAQGARLLGAALRAEPFDVSTAVEAICDEIDRSYLDPSTASIVAAATERGIPHLRLNDGNLVQLRHGARQRRIWTSETSQTGAIAHGINHGWFHLICVDAIDQESWYAYHAHPGARDPWHGAVATLHRAGRDDVHRHGPGGHRYHHGHAGGHPGCGRWRHPAVCRRQR